MRYIKKLPKEGNKDIARVELLCCDVDGVLTDGGVYYDKGGLAFMRFDIRDGAGIKKLKEVGVKICFISQSDSPIINSRAKKLDIDFCIMGVDDKKTKIIELLSKLKIDIQNVCHIADDINDLALLKIVGVAVTVPSAIDEVKSIARYITYRDGGAGALRELCDSIYASRVKQSCS